jgi:hypothetical protein
LELPKEVNPNDIRATYWVVRGLGANASLCRIRLPVHPFQFGGREKTSAKAIFNCGKLFVKRFFCNFTRSEADAGRSRGKTPQKGRNVLTVFG